MQNYSRPVATARDYYNSPDADHFYYSIWGGEDIHIGLYDHEREAIVDASRRTVAHMADLLGESRMGMRVLDMGSGYGGSARYLAENHGCQVTALNLSELENERNRSINQVRGLDSLIEVVDGSFEAVPAPDAEYDVVWSQDAFLHSGEREQALHEAERVLKPGGVLIFTDPMAHDECPEGVLDPILERIHLDSLGSPGFYRETAAMLDLEPIGFEDHRHQLSRHYQRVREELEAREADLASQISPDYISRMKKGLRHWVDCGKAGHLVWGIFRFRKPA